MDFVEMELKRNRGWPAPDESWGLEPMFGEGGWCRSCGTPLREQCGALTLRATGLASLLGAWVPNWRFDAICVDASLGAQINDRFAVELREVAWARSAPGVVLQIVVPTVGKAWYDPDELRSRTLARHGSAGATCPECGIWRWFPLSPELMPPVLSEEVLGGGDVAGSPEWFGDGCRSFRQILIRRELAELIASASPKDFRILEVV